VIKLTIKLDNTVYPRTDVVCPMCGEIITYWNISPYACVKCKGVLPNIDGIVRCCENRKEYYTTTKERW